jgi:hypothetical protein
MRHRLKEMLWLLGEERLLVWLEDDITSAERFGEHVEAVIASYADRGWEEAGARHLRLPTSVVSGA